VIFQQCRQFLNECMVNHVPRLALDMKWFLLPVKFHAIIAACHAPDKDHPLRGVVVTQSHK